jgi:hypothetical protein
MKLILTNFYIISRSFQNTFHCREFSGLAFSGEKEHEAAGGIMSLVIGFIAGNMGAFLGIGGGVIMIPLLSHFYKLMQRESHGTSLLALTLTGIIGATVYALNNKVDYLASFILAISAIGTARFGALCCYRMKEWQLRRIFGSFLIIVPILIFTNFYFAWAAVPASGWANVAILLAIGGVTGFLSGLLGIGGGPIMIAGMVLFAGMGQIEAQGSSLLCMIPIGAAGATTHWQLGNIRKDVLPGLLSGILVGALTGGILAQYMPETLLKIIFSVLLLWTGLRYLRSKPEGPICEPDSESF